MCCRGRGCGRKFIGLGAFCLCVQRTFDARKRRPFCRALFHSVSFLQCTEKVEDSIAHQGWFRNFLPEAPKFRASAKLASAEASQSRSILADISLWVHIFRASRSPWEGLGPRRCGLSWGFLLHLQAPQLTAQKRLCD